MSNHFNPEKVIDFNIDYYDVLGLEKVVCLLEIIAPKERESQTS